MAATARLTAPGLPRWVGARAHFSNGTPKNGQLTLKATIRVPRLRGLAYRASLALRNAR